MRVFATVVFSILLFWWFAPLAVLILPFAALMHVGQAFRKIDFADGMSYWVFNSENRFVRNITLIFYVWCLRMPLVSVSRREADVERPSDIACWKCGFFTLEFIRRALGTAHENIDEIDREYLSARSLKTDIGIILKSIPAFFLYAEVSSEEGAENRLFGVKFVNITMRGAVSLLAARIKSREKTIVSFVNPDCFNKVLKNNEYRRCLAASTYVFPDGIGLVIACRLRGRPLRQNINGTDMLPFLCEAARQIGFRIALLGAGPGVAETMRKNLESKYPGIKICYVRDGFFASSSDETACVAELAATAPDLTLVAMGVPRQEFFISRHFNDMNTTAAIGVGGLFDFYSGRIRRAPKWLRDFGLEWSYRLAMEPKRMFKRYILGNPLFLWRVFTVEKKIDAKEK